MITSAWKCFDLVANNTGGAVAQIVAARLGERLSTLTLTNCDTEGNTPPTPVQASRSRRTRGTAGQSRAAHRGQPGSCCVGLPPAIAIRAGFRARWSTPTTVPSWAHRNPPALSRAWWPQSRRPTWQGGPTPTRPTQGPTLVVWGTGDPFFPLKWGQRLSDLIPGTTTFATLERRADALPR